MLVFFLIISPLWSFCKNEGLTESMACLANKAWNVLMMCMESSNRFPAPCLGEAAIPQLSCPCVDEAQEHDCNCCPTTNCCLAAGSEAEAVTTNPMLGSTCFAALLFDMSNFSTKTHVLHLVRMEWISSLLFKFGHVRSNSTETKQKMSFPYLWEPHPVPFIRLPHWQGKHDADTDSVTERLLPE